MRPNRSTTARRKAAMAVADMTQSRLADKVGVSQPAISRYIAGQFLPRMNVAQAIAKTLGVSFDWLWLGADEGGIDL